MSYGFRWSIRRLRVSLGLLPFLTVGVGLLLAGALPAAPDAPDQAKDGEPKADEHESEIQLAARTIVEGIKMTALMGDERQRLELLKQPVLRYGDLARNNDKGTVWVWQRSGRPQAVMELFRGDGSRVWVHAIHSLSADALDGDFGALAPHWTPPREAVQWKDLAAAQSPAGRPAARARQIKDLAQRFTAHEFWDPNNSRFELRLLVQPACKYSDPEGGLLDGALFLLCHATNPEVVLLIEAVQEDGGPKFRYALARLGHAELHVAFEGKEVWRQERAGIIKPTDPYWFLVRGVNP